MISLSFLSGRCRLRNVKFTEAAISSPDETRVPSKSNTINFIYGICSLADKNITFNPKNKGLNNSGSARIPNTITELY
jgi:hypothetical protein